MGVESSVPFHSHEGTKQSSQYEARVYIGYDSTSKNYVVHWIDMFGGRVSETLGHGTREGNSIKAGVQLPLTDYFTTP
jgi:hypothetical protein